MNKNKKPTIEEILNFNFSEELDIESLPPEEQDEFNKNIFASLIERLINKTTESFSLADRENIFSKIENNNESLEEVFKFIASKNENFLEDIGGEFLDFKAEIYDLLKN